MPGDITDPWLEPDDGSSPGQISEPLRASVSRRQTPKEPDQGLAPPRSLIIEVLESVQERRGPEARVLDLDDHDEEMPDKSVDATDSQQISDPPSSAHSSSSSSSSLKEMTFDDDDAKAIPLEDLRKQKVTTFDTSELDSFLMKQAEPESKIAPQELAHTQLWGNIDPRITWPPEPNEDWLAEKRREIEARGGRKANYGKHLTAQVRKEREEKGWSLHQNSNAPPDHIIAETSKHMEELFGANLVDLVPGVRDGQIVMVEKEKPAEAGGKRKRQEPLKYYPVF